MGFTFDIFEIASERVEIKKIFGNRKNWERFCAIANSMEAQLSLVKSLDFNLA